mgnify:FL=1
MHKIVIFLVAFSVIDSIRAETWTLPPADIDIFGQVQITTASREETLLDIARRSGLGQDEIMLANPNVDRWLPVDGSEVVLPNRYIIPQAERKGLVLNLPEMRLYYFPEPKNGEKPAVITHPVSIGRMDWKTPLGKTKIANKVKDPSWTPPQSLRDEAIAAGDPPLPNVVPPSPNNPLGRFAMHLGTPSGSYLIHGTNEKKSFGIGMRVTHGCIRMYPEDIEALFAIVPVGTQVQIVNQPIKLGWLADSLFIELHPPLEEDVEEYADYMQKVLDSINGFLTRDPNNVHRSSLTTVNIDELVLRQAVAERDGVPVLISK